MQRERASIEKVGFLEFFSLDKERKEREELKERSLKTFLGIKTVNSC